MAGDMPGWTACVCPICRFLARTCPRLDHGQAIACERCGDFDLSDAAEDVVDTYAGPLDRRRLSEALRDVCMMAECERPMIDSITAEALVGFVTICA